MKKKDFTSKTYVATTGIDIDPTKTNKAIHFNYGDIIKDVPETFDWEGLLNVGAIEVVKGGK